VESWKVAFESHTDLGKYGSSALGLFALALRFGLDDLDSVAAESITEGSDDKKCDLLYIDKEDEGVAVVIQSYVSTVERASAPANKASDLNTAIAWLLQRPLEELPLGLQPSAKELRNCLNNNLLSNLHVWYVHNLPESKNVKDELDTVYTTVHTALTSHFPDAKTPTLNVMEVGSETLQEWYNEIQSPILISDSFSIEVPGGFELKAPKWEAYVTAVPATFLRQLYRNGKYKKYLFSANVRDYLGARKSDDNINNGIRRTAEEDPENFWAFNNGVTILTNEFTATPIPKSNALKLEIKGISIVNGAQTTGALGSLKNQPEASALVPVRLIKTTDADIIQDTIRFNNSQNRITAADFRSTDRIQKKLRDEMRQIPETEYEGGRRGGYADVIRRRANLIPSYSAGQALAAFYQDPTVAYNEKSDIWAKDSYYSRYFNEDTTAAYVVFAYSLVRAVEGRKIDLVEKSSKAPSSLTKSEQLQLEFFRKRGSIYLFVSAIASCIETFVGRAVPNPCRLSFGNSVSLRQAIAIWKRIVETTNPLATSLEEAIADGLKSATNVKKAINTFQSLVQSTREANKPIYDEFASKID